MLTTKQLTQVATYEKILTEININCLIKFLKDQMKWPLFSKERIQSKEIQNKKKLQVFHVAI